MSCVPHYVFISNLLKQQVSPLILMCHISLTFLIICVWAQEQLKNIPVLLLTPPDNQKMFQGEGRAVFLHTVNGAREAESYFQDIYLKWHQYS